jgi:hypothetical protein
MKARLFVAAVACALLAVPACRAPRGATPTGESPRLRITAVELGRAVSADKRVAQPADRFAPGDTVYASVVTEGEADLAVLEARWSSESAIVDETRQRIAPDGSAVTEFHVFDPSGWKPGRYQVEIFLDGTPVARRGFTVESAS